MENMMKSRKPYFLLLTFTVMMLCIPSPIFASAKDRLEKSYSLESGGRVTLQNVAGGIFIKGWEKDQVGITATHAGGPKKDLNEVVHITQTNGNIRITTQGDGSFRLFGSGRTYVYYELLVPASTHFKIETTSGDIEILDFNGSLEVRTVSGDIKIYEVKSSVKCRTISGDINLERITGDTEVKTTSGELVIHDLEGSLEAESVSGDMVLKKIVGNVDLKTTSGEIEVRKLVGSFEAESVSGDIDVKSFSRAEDMEIETVSGDISLEGFLVPNGSYAFDSHSGDVRLEIPGNSNFDLQTRTSSGDIDCDFELEGFVISDRKSLQGIAGKGGSSLNMSTFSGDIRINKR
jgi:DUF4097 and DUF4098 domain-containing protein YvlB